MALSLDPHVFRACADPFEHFPEAGALVYYFPRGHAEQEESGDPKILPEGTEPYFICRVETVSLLAHPKSDEVFVRFRLKADQDACRDDTGVVSDTKVLKPSNANPLTDTAPAAVTDTDQDVGQDDTSVVKKPGPATLPAASIVCFKKRLSNSDVKTNPYLFVPHNWVKRIVPSLKPGEKQKILVKDIHGNDLSFNYIHRKNPPPHRLMTGWTKFVKKKSLVSGDTLIAIENDNKLVFGLRRTVTEQENLDGGFSRRSLRRLKAKAILEAVKKAQEGKGFEVDYYPRAEFAEFVVKKDDVEKAIEVKWEKVAEEKTEVQIRNEYFRVYQNFGWVSSLLSTVSSPWRMLEVSERGTSEKRIISPWQVKVSVSPHPMTSEASGRNDTNVSQDRMSQSQISPKGPVLKRKKL